MTRWATSRLLRTIEINGSFYALRRPESYRAWFAATPDDFLFSVKGGRFIAHLLKLRNVGAGLPNFFASGVLALGAEQGPSYNSCPRCSASTRSGSTGSSTRSPGAPQRRRRSPAPMTSGSTGGP